MLSPIDWALIEAWKERGVPLHVALRGIEHAFDSHEAKQQKRTVKTLLYCQEEVEAQYAEWLESRVGGHEPQTETTPDEDKSPFARSAVTAHLERKFKELTALSDQRAETKDELADAFARAARLLAGIQDEYTEARVPDTRKLEESLTGVERMLDDAMLAVITKNERDAMATEIDSQLKAYKRQMDKATFEQTRDNLLRKRTREHFGVPRLSLFFLHS